MRSSARNEEHRAWPGAIPITSAYTAGVAGQIFFDALKQSGKLIATRCRPCKQVYLPARLFCERCLGALTEQVEIKNTGVLVSYTLCHVDRDRRPLRRPQALALVQLDGATTVMLHYLLDVSRPEQIAIGAQVEAVIKPKVRRSGSILDIAGFRLIDGSKFSSKRKRKLS